MELEIVSEALIDWQITGNAKPAEGSSLDFHFKFKPGDQEYYCLELIIRISIKDLEGSEIIRSAFQTDFQLRNEKGSPTSKFLYCCAFDAFNTFRSAFRFKTKSTGLSNDFPEMKSFEILEPAIRLAIANHVWG